MSRAAQPEEAIFLAALDKPTPQQRADYLSEACSGSESLRRRVLELLASHNASQGPLDAPPPDVGARVDQPFKENLGSQIGPYKLLEQIGEGGMGLVFMADQQRPVRRMVALKIIKPGMDSRLVIARFEAERQALAMMDHANIAKVLDAGTTQADRPYFVMELVKGVPITRYCDENHVTIKERLELFVAICQAIQHAHQKGIIHRDLKPSNVLIALYDDQPVPKVIDFGVAKATGQKLTEKTMFTGFGQLVGTLEYMSPEQAQFNQLDIDTRSDIYSLGVLLYELLTGTTPLGQSRRETVALDETLRIIREEEPPKPSTRLSTIITLPMIAANRNVAPAQLRRQIAGDLDWIVMKCLEKDRNRRYETALSLASDIRHYLQNEPVHAYPPSAVYRLKKFVLRQKGTLALTAGVLMVVLAAAASFGWAIRDRAAREFEIARTQSERRATVQRQVRDSLDLVGALVAEGKLASARETLARARAQLGTDGSALDDLLVEVHERQADLDRFQQFFDLIDRANQAETAPLEPELAVDIPGASILLASTRDLQRTPEAAVPFLLEALRRYGVLDRDDWHNTLEQGFLAVQQREEIRRASYEILLWLADDVDRRRQDHVSEQVLPHDSASRLALRYLDQAESAYRSTQALYVLRARCKEALGDDAGAQTNTKLAAQTAPTIAFDHFLRGQAAFDAKKPTEAAQAFESALRLEPTHYRSLMKLGNCLHGLGQRETDFAAAVHIYTGCILKRPEHAHAYYCRASAYRKLRRYGEAVADFSKAIELDPQHVGAWYFRGGAYRILGQPDKAIADYSKAIELDPKHAFAWYNRGQNREKLNQFDHAIADYSRAIELKPTLTFAWYGRAMLHESARRREQAIADYTKTIELDPKFAAAWFGRGVAYERLRQPQMALADYTRAIEQDPRYARAWYARGGIYKWLRQPDMALADLTKSIELDPTFTGAWYHRAATFNLLDQPQQAIADYSRAIELAPTRTAALNDLAWLLATCPDETLRDPERAVELATKAVELSPADGNYWNTLGAAHCRAGNWASAIAALDKAIALRDGGDAIDWLYLAMSYGKLGRHDQALAAYEEALQWLKNNQEKLEKDTRSAERLHRLQTEAAEALGRSPPN